MEYLCTENLVLQHSLGTEDEALEFSNLYIALKMYPMRCMKTPHCFKNQLCFYFSVICSLYIFFAVRGTGDEKPSCRGTV